MTLNTYKIVGITKFNRINENGESRTSYLAHCVSKDKIATDGYRVTSVFCTEDNSVGEEVKIGFVNSRDRIVKVN